MGIKKDRIKVIKSVLRMLGSYNELSNCKPFVERLNKHGYSIEPIDDDYFTIRCNVQLYGKYAVNHATINLKNLSSYNEYLVKRKRDEKIDQCITRTKEDVIRDVAILRSYNYKNQFKEYFADKDLRKYNPWLNHIGISLKLYPSTKEQFEEQEKEIMHYDALLREMKDGIS